MLPPVYEDLPQILRFSGACCNFSIFPTVSHTGVTGIPWHTMGCQERKLTSKAWVCCSSAGVSEPEPPMAPLAAKPSESEARGHG